MQKKSDLYKILMPRLSDFSEFTGIPVSKLFIAGGSIASILRGETPRDFDFWCIDINETKNALEKFCLLTSTSFQIFNNSHKIYSMSEGTPYPYAFGSSVHTNMIRPGKVSWNDKEDLECLQQDFRSHSFESGGKFFYEQNGLKLSQWAITAKFEGRNDSVLYEHQLITRLSESPEFVTSQFDFDHCKAYFHIHSGLVIPEETKDSIESSQLRYTGTGTVNPLYTLLRMKKFIDRGWQISRGEVANIAMALATSGTIPNDEMKDYLVEQGVSI